MASQTPAYNEIWHTAPDGGHLCALTSGEVGWLMYLRETGDAGFSSRNPDYRGPAGQTAAFQLSNGQVDEYPLAWCYPTDVVRRAVEHFVATGTPPLFVGWHNDSGDGRRIGSWLSRDGERFGRATGGRPQM